MIRESPIRQNLALIVFTGAILLCASAIGLYISVTGGADRVENLKLMRHIGKGLGISGLSVLVFVYARTAFKLLVRKESFWKRLEPFTVDYAAIKTASGKILYYLNKSHPYLGVSGIALIYFHCYFISRFYNLLPLRLVLTLLAWQGVWGVALKIRFAPGFLRGKIHLFHSQLYTGALILILTATGHLIMLLEL